MTHKSKVGIKSRRDRCGHAVFISDGAGDRFLSNLSPYVKAKSEPFIGSDLERRSDGVNERRQKNVAANDT